MLCYSLFSQIIILCNNLKHCITACYKVLFPVTTLITPVTHNSVMSLGMGRIQHRLSCRVVGCLPALYLPTAKDSGPMPSLFIRDFITHQCLT
jgi:hypothetical protein